MSRDLTIPADLVEELDTQLAAQRSLISDARKEDWDRSALGQLYSMIIQETSTRRRRADKKKVVKKRQSIRSRFR